jgi:hypothetical protein
MLQSRSAFRTLAKNRTNSPRRRGRPLRHFQIAEVAVPKELFQKILRLIHGLRPRPAPAGQLEGGCLITPGGVV